MDGGDWAIKGSMPAVVIQHITRCVSKVELSNNIANSIPFLTNYDHISYQMWKKHHRQETVGVRDGQFLTTHKLLLEAKCTEFSLMPAEVDPRFKV